METSTPELTLGQRLAADTPTFFKKVELAGLALAAIGGSLTQVPNLPVWLAPVILGIAATLAVISKFAVKDTSVLTNPNATIADYSAVLADLPNQFEQLHAGIKNTVDAINAGQVKPAVPPVETPIVKEAPVAIPQAALNEVSPGLGSIAPTSPLQNSISQPVINPIN